MGKIDSRYLIKNQENEFVTFLTENGFLSENLILKDTVFKPESTDFNQNHPKSDFQTKCKKSTKI